MMLYFRVCGDSNGDEWISSSWGEKYLMTLIFDSKFGKLHSPELGFSLRASVASDGNYHLSCCIYVKAIQFLDTIFVDYTKNKNSWTLEIVVLKIFCICINDNFLFQISC